MVMSARTSLSPTVLSTQGAITDRPIKVLPGLGLDPDRGRHDPLAAQAREEVVLPGLRERVKTRRVLGPAINLVCVGDKHRQGRPELVRHLRSA
jgi:hypothetical protein